MDSAFLNLVRGNRVTSYLGLQMVDGKEYKYGPIYQYVEVPVLGFGSDTGELVDEVKRNQHVFVQPACSINVRGGQTVEVEPNPSLAAFGQVQAGYKVHPASGEMVPGFWFTARKDTKLSDLTYAIRLYMYS